MLKMIGQWNSLEVAKLLVATLTPIAVLLLGIWVRQIVGRIEERQWQNTTLIEWRIRVFEKVGPLLNDLFCYGMYIGDWKRITPPELIEKKRILDREFTLTRALFSANLISVYQDFMRAIFLENSGKGHSALILANREMHKKFHAGAWRPDWDELFIDPKNRTRRETLKPRYENLMANFEKEIHIFFDK
jgi:hypothetical protein